MKLICEYYWKNFEKNNIESINNLNNLMMQFPTLDKIKQIIRLKLISNTKELYVLKVILDLFEHYYKNFDLPTYERLLHDYISVAELFYSELSSNDCLVVYDCMKDHYELYEILTKKFNIYVNKNPSGYLKNLAKLKENYQNLVGGIDYSKFLK